MERRHDGYRWGGARALVALHERELRRFVEVWRAAAADGVRLPASDDPDCASLEALLSHVLRAARGYLLWCCRVLGLPDPGVDAVPDDVAGRLDAYVEHVLERWDGPLKDVDGKTGELEVFPAPWGPAYCVDAMLEHAVMHPLRHTNQLLRARGTPDAV
ncbi:MAG: hypothetical protein R3F05_03035 [Planctomycetota bacterium]|nr:hypothetical protein [Planctomycetota bacterium]MCB9824994.1 hypothetical protein [Planctomycetota bacterium]MCB9902013.1 hypothetical protein [Planctomycetota bacterium]